MMDPDFPIKVLSKTRVKITMGMIRVLFFSSFPLEIMARPKRIAIPTRNMIRLVRKLMEIRMKTKINAERPRKVLIQKDLFSSIAATVKIRIAPMKIEKA